MINTSTLLTDILIEGNSSFGYDKMSITSQKLNFLASDVSSSDSYSQLPDFIHYNFNADNDIDFVRNAASVLELNANANISTDLGAQIGTGFTGRSALKYTLTDPSVTNSSTSTAGLIQFWG